MAFGRLPLPLTPHGVTNPLTVSNLLFFNSSEPTPADWIWFWEAPPLSILNILASAGQPPTKRWWRDVSYYVPEPVWTGTPTENLLINALTSAKVFGQNGQVPTKQWHYDFVPDPVWQGSPIDSPIIAILSSQSVFGAGGQVPTKQWHYDYVPDTFWQGSPVDSPIISILSKQIVYGAGGQVPTKTWHYDYVPDAVWTWEAPPALTLYLPAPTAQPPTKFWRYDYVPDTIWQGSPVNSPIIEILTNQTMFGAPGQVPTKLWRYDYVPEPFWEWTSPNSLSLYIPPPTSQPSTKFWRYDFEVDWISRWQGAPTPSHILQILAAAGKPVVNLPKWHNLPETIWVGAPNQAYTNYLPAPVGGTVIHFNPFFTHVGRMMGM